jgi:hypothetical protein
MKLSKSLSLLVTVFILGTVTACASGSRNADKVVSGSNSQPASSALSSTPESQDTAQSDRTTPIAPATTSPTLPKTKTYPMSVEGEKTDITLKLYDERSQDFTTYIPEDDFVAESVSSGEGTGTRLFYNVTGTQDKDAYISIFFPNQDTTFEQVEALVTGKGGLVESNQWQVLNRTKDVPYSWAKEKISYQKGTGTPNIVGEVYIGHDKGKAFYVVTQYPAEYGDGFAPRSYVVLNNLQVSASN